MSREVAHTLSPREGAILKLASEGFTDSAIANQLEISEGTVGTYWGRIRTKLGPYSRPELVAIAIRSELTQEIAALEAQRNSLQRELEHTSAAEKLYEEIVDSADEGVLIINDTGRIEHVNPAASEIFGYTKEEIVANSLSHLIPERFRIPHLRHFTDFFSEPNRRRMNEHSDTFGLTKDGREVLLYITLSAVHREGQELVTCFIRQG